uniref:Zn(2)-C6 fungal-type domain-containing protein n=1 Tax=Kalmanozyma brasiliensis (strain GHG001) TaxID=1365824 RepID=V5GV72_KALBG
MADAPKPNVNTRMPKGAKRPKTSRACLACRKLKARCEPAAGAKPVTIDDPQSSSTAYTICHRCKTLCIDCLYETPSGQVVKGEDVQPLSASTPSPPAEHNRPPRSNKRSRPEDDPSATSNPFSNDRAVFLSPAISPSPLTRSVYRDIDICSLQNASPASLERPVLIANAFSRLIGAAPALKSDAQQYLLKLSGAFPQETASSNSWKQAPPDLCIGKAAARLMSGHAPSPPYPQHELIFLSRLLQPHEHPMRILFQGLYGPFTPFLSIPFEESLNLSTCQSEAQCFLLLTIYLVALPHLEPTMSIGPVRQPLRKAVDAMLRRAMHSSLNDHLNIFALHNCASFLLLPVDGMVEAHRPISTPEQEDDGLLEFALDLNPRAAIITALIVAQQLGYASLASKLPTIRQSIETDSPAVGHAADEIRDEYAHAVLCTFTWLTLLQFRASIDVAEERIEWDSLAQFEHEIPRVRIEALTASILPPPSFLSPREQSRCCWMAQRAELYAIARDHRHTKRASASFTKKEAEEQAAAYKKAVDEWRYKFNEQMRSMSTEFRRDPRGLGLHRYYSIFANAEAQSLQVSIGSVYHKEFVSDMRPRLEDPFYQDSVPWKSAPTIMLGHENDRLTKAILINFAFTDAMLKAMGHISSLTPVMPQLYDFVSYEESAGSEIPSLCIVAPPNIQAGLFAVPLLAAADLRLSVIETWGASASYFNHHILPLLTNCVKSLRACHVNVALPGVLKIPFTTANPIADYLQGPFEILMRKVASAEERLQISHVESILTNAFLLSRKKKEIETIAEELAPDAPEMVQAIADSQKIEDEISASMMGSLHVQAIQEIEEDETDYAVKVFGSDLRQGDIKAIRKSSSGIRSNAATPDAEGSARRGRQIRQRRSIVPISVAPAATIGIRIRSGDCRSAAYNAV